MPPRRLLSDAELEQLTTWPPVVVRSDLVAFFTLDVAAVLNRLGRRPSDQHHAISGSFPAVFWHRYPGDPVTWH